MRAYAGLMVFEGKYANHPSDRGGETYKGISRKAWPDWAGWVGVDTIKSLVGSMPKYGSKEYQSWVKAVNALIDHDGRIRQLVITFYRENFWRDEYEQIKPAKIADWLFEKFVNTGSHKRPARWLQLALEVRADGVIGPVTLAKINSLPDPKETLNVAREHAREFYRGIVERDPSQAAFLNGWLARA